MPKQIQPKMLQLMATADRKNKRPNGCSEIVPEMQQQKQQQSHPRRRKSAQLYRQYVGRSNLFGETRGDGTSQRRNNNANNANNGRWPPSKSEVAQRGPIRMVDSNPTPNQLEWQRQRRARAMSASGASTTSGFSAGCGGIVQRHAEMRSYLQHCQRVLNARPRVDSSVSASKRMSRFSTTTAPLTSETRRMSNDGEQKRRTQRAKSVPTSGKNEQIREDNERLLNRLLQISLRSPPRHASSSKKNSKDGFICR